MLLKGPFQEMSNGEGEKRGSRWKIEATNVKGKTRKKSKTFLNPTKIGIAFTLDRID